MLTVLNPLFLLQTVVVAQLVRAPDCGSGGRRFETDLPPQKLQGIAEMQSLFYGLYPTVRNQKPTLRN